MTDETAIATYLVEQEGVVGDVAVAVLQGGQECVAAGHGGGHDLAQGDELVVLLKAGKIRVNTLVPWIMLRQ